MPDRKGRRELSAAQEEEVRLRLAEARHTEPMPPEVADRLDRVLGDLASEPVRRASVLRLADRRRRAATMLVAAAAVVVGGVTVGQIVGGQGDEGAGSAGDASVAEDEGGAGVEEPGQESAAEDRGPAEVLPTTRVVRVRPGEFSTDVARLQTRRADLAFDADPGAGTSRQPGSAQSAVEVCEPGDWGAGRYQAVRYGKNTGFVVFRRPQGDTQVADLFLCGGEDAVRSVTLPSR